MTFEEFDKYLDMHLSPKNIEALQKDVLHATVNDNLKKARYPIKTGRLSMSHDVSISSQRNFSTKKATIVDNVPYAFDVWEKNKTGDNKWYDKVNQSQVIKTQAPRVISNFFSVLDYMSVKPYSFSLKRFDTDLVWEKHTGGVKK